MKTFFPSFLFAILLSILQVAPSALALGTDQGSKPTDLYAEAAQLRNCTAGTPECYAKAVDLANRYVMRRSNAPFIIASSHYSKNVAVLVHSFTMSPNEMRVWAALLTARGFNVLAPVLEAHSQDGIAMVDVTREDWQNDLRFSLDIAHQLGENVLLMGYSLGGLLTVDSTIKYPNEIKAIGLVAPALGLTIPLAGISCVGKALIGTNFANWTARQFTGNNLGNYQRDFIRGACPLRSLIYGIDRSIPYENIQTGTLQHSNIDTESTDDHAKRVYAQIKSPTFMTYTADDEIVSQAALNTFVQNISTRPSIVHFSHGVGHLGINNPELTGDDNKNLGNEFVRFVEQNFQIELPVETPPTPANSVAAPQHRRRR